MTRDAAQGLAHIRAFSMTDIKAIETRYKGYRFRSRLEARWAVFFDALGLTWDYEPEGFETDAGWYLPDFRLTIDNPSDNPWVWVEVKPQKLNETEREKAFAVSSYTNAIVFELNQIPEPENIRPYGTYVGVRYYVGSHMKDVRSMWCTNDLIGFYEDQTQISPGTGNLPDALKFDTDYWRNKYGNEHTYHFLNGMVRELQIGRGCSCTAAINAARSARFEHGETP